MPSLRSSYLLALLLLVYPLALQAAPPAAPEAEEEAGAEPEGDVHHAFVRLLSTDGSTLEKRHSTTGLKFTFEVQNTLPVAVRRPRFTVEARLRDGSTRTLELVADEALQPNETRQIRLEKAVRWDVRVESFIGSIAEYELDALHADVLLNLVISDDSDALSAVHALGLDPLQPDSEARRAAARADRQLVAALGELLTTMPTEPSFERTLQAHLAVRALGALGSPEQAPALLSALRPNAVHSQVLAGALYAKGVPEVWASVLGPQLTLSSTVTAALRELDPKNALATLVTQKAPRGSMEEGELLAARAMGWPTLRAQADALQQAGAPVVDALAARLSPEDTMLLVLLAARGNAAAKAALEAFKSPALLTTSIASFLGEEVDAAQAFALEQLARHPKEAAQALKAAESELGLTAAQGADLAARAKAVAAARTREDAAQLAQAAAPRADAAEWHEAIEETFGAIRTPAQQTQVAAALLEWSLAQLQKEGKMEQLGYLGLAEVELLLGGRAPTEHADAAFAKVAARLAAKGEPRARWWLGRLEALVHGEAGRVALAQAYESLAASASWAEQEALLARALALNPASPRALKLQEGREAAERFAKTAPVVLLLVIAGICWLIVRSSRGPFREGTCGVCGREAPLNQVSMNYNIGLLISRLHGKTEGALCKGCVQATFLKYLAINLVLGWWGIISLVVTPFFLLGNAFHFLRAWNLPRKKDDGFGVAPSPEM